MKEKLLRLLILVFVVVAALNIATVSSEAHQPSKSPTNSEDHQPSKSPTNSTGTATSSDMTDKTDTTANPPTLSSIKPSNKLSAFSPNNTALDTGNKGLLSRSLHVAVGLSAVVIIYFIVRTIRTKRRKSKTKKYGVIHGAGDMEMQPLEREDDEDEDLTVFDMNDRHNNK